MQLENDYFELEVKIDAIIAEVFSNNTVETICFGNAGYKNKNDKMNDLEKDLYNSFNNDIQKYLFLNGLQKFNNKDLEDVLEKRKYLTSVMAFEEKDKDLITERINMLDKLMTNYIDIDYKTIYNKEENTMMFLKPTYKELEEKLSPKKVLKYDKH